MLSELAPLYPTFRLSTRLFQNCLDGIDDELAARRLTGNTNNLVFLASHLVDPRFFMERLFGGKYATPLPTLEAVRSVDQLPEEPPTVSELLDLWAQVSRRLDRSFEAVSHEQMLADSPFPFYPKDVPQTNLQGLAFLLGQENYHIGQMALIRKTLGLQSMKYD